MLPQIRLERVFAKHLAIDLGALDKAAEAMSAHTLSTDPALCKRRTSRICLEALWEGFDAEQ